MILHQYTFLAYIACTFQDGICKVWIPRVGISGLFLLGFFLVPKVKSSLKGIRFEMTSLLQSLMNQYKEFGMYYIILKKGKVTLKLHFIEMKFIETIISVTEMM